MGLMGELHAFFDKDVFIKLACCDLWEEALEVLGVTHPYRLASATALGSKTALRRMAVDDALRAAVTERLQKMAEQVPVMPKGWVEAVVTTDLYNKMIFHEGIDSGEAEIALVALHCEHDNKLVTGDKRFLAAMADAFPGEFGRLKPVVVTFEHCLLAICEAKGYEHVRERLVAAKGCDGSLKNAVGSDGQAGYESFKEAMLSFTPV
ncbi:hypothetical protein amb4432 [Paramagnetospirillum magneticum AMB-1]|uniref:PIN domain-containing protein n=2 Tax=Paramagnetospirillum magneticum TaxID=84159 RepID=Q2VYT9_PARM1|nr:hypothetical protein amb4432 [Paramagnetospirillum magneticum AMB-1]